MALPEDIELKKTPLNAIPALVTGSTLEYTYTDINTRCFDENFSLLINHYKKELKITKRKKAKQA